MSSWTLPRTAGFSLRQPLSRIVTGLSRMRAIHRQRQALARLDARALADIGLSAAAARAEARRAPWDLPQGRQL
jgi:uncharacterized protein YjiS (DUF1127 family)